MKTPTLAGLGRSADEEADDMTPPARKPTLSRLLAEDCARLRTELEAARQALGEAERKAEGFRQHAEAAAKIARVADIDRDRLSTEVAGLREALGEHRAALFMCAAHCQGGHSGAGAAAATALGIRFPVSMDDMVKAAVAEGREPTALWPWLTLAAVDRALSSPPRSTT